MAYNTEEINGQKYTHSAWQEVYDIWGGLGSMNLQEQWLKELAQHAQINNLSVMEMADVTFVENRWIEEGKIIEQ